MYIGSIFCVYEVKIGCLMGEGLFGIVYEGFIYKGMCGNFIFNRFV